MTHEYDAILVGAGHNGLVAACRLATAGWKVLVLEQAAQPGGAVWSGELTRPGFVHDGHSTNHNLFLASPFYQEHAGELERNGLAYAISEHPYANVFPEAPPLRAHQDVERTVAGLDPADRPGWRQLDALFERLSPALFSIHGAPAPSRANATATLGLLRTLAGQRRAMPDVTRLLLSTSREFVDEHLVTPEAKAALACWGMHLDFGPDIAGGAMFAFLESFADQRTGMAITRGGASKMIDALIALLRARGGAVRTEARVSSVTVAGGRATGVVLADGERLTARRAVVASVTPGQLAGMLQAPPASMAQQARRFRYGPGGMMVHLALDGPVPWRDGADLTQHAYVHVGPYVDDLARTYTAAVSGRLPAEPMLVVGQTSSVDATRAPEGHHVVWIQVRALPGRPLSDDAGQIDVGDGDWDALSEPYAERVLDKLEVYAPGLRSRIVGRAVLTPADLERRNPNLVGGDSIAGSMHLSQSFVLRPQPRTAVDGLWLTGTTIWPGPGITALPGDHTAAAVLREAAGPRRPWRRAAQS